MRTKDLHARFKGLVIPIFDESHCVAELRPVSLAPQDVELLTKWRNNHRESFFTWFTATKEGTKEWLEKQVISKGDRMLFMIEANRVPFGHIGLCDINPSTKSCEVDNVLRGRSEFLPGGITLALKALLSWTQRHLGILTFHVRVFSDNNKAISVYKRCGFVVVSEAPLRKVEEGDMVRWVEAQYSSEEAAAKFVANMRLQNVSFGSC